MSSKLALRRRRAFAAYVQHLSRPEEVEHRGVLKTLTPASERYIQLLHALQRRAERSGRTHWLQEALDAGRRVRVWSDLHLEHANIIKYAGRPFGSVEHMNAHFESQVATVAADELMLVLGDWSLGGGQLSRLHWETTDVPKALIAGNHDLNWLESGVRDGVFAEADALQVISWNGREFWLTHYPIRPSLLPAGVINMHGHIHERMVPGGRHINLSVEHTGYKLLDVADVLAANIGAPSRGDGG